MIRVWLRLGGAALLALGCAACGGGGEARAGGGRGAGPAVEPVTRGDLRERLVLTGELEAQSSVELRAPRTDQWQLSIRWLVEDGARVAKGDKLVEFDNSAFASQLEERRLRLSQMRLDLATAEATTAMARADKEAEVERTRVRLERAELLAGVPQDLLAEREWQSRQLALERARVEHARARQDLRTAVETGALDLEVKRIERDKLRREVEIAEQGIAALSLTAPRDGIAVLPDHPWEGRQLVAGDMVQPGWSVVELPDLSAVQVLAYLSDVDDGRVTPGQRVTCRLDAHPDLPLEGVVEAVTAVAHEVGRRSLRRAFNVTIKLDRTDPERMRPGMSVQVEVAGPVHEGVLLAPRAGLDLAGEEPAARLAGGERVAVTLGPCDAQRCVVESGLAEGQRLEAGVTR